MHSQGQEAMEAAEAAEAAEASTTAPVRSNVRHTVASRVVLDPTEAAVAETGCAIYITNPGTGAGAAQDPRAACRDALLSFIVAMLDYALGDH